MMLDPDLDLWITGCPVYCPTTGGHPWELSLDELKSRTMREPPSSSRTEIAPPNDIPLPPVGLWRAYRGHPYWVEQFQTLPIDSVMFAEDVNDPGIRLSLEAYVEYFHAGFEPPPADVVFNEPAGRLITLNRRRVWAAKLAGRKTFPAWVGGFEYAKMIERAKEALR